MGRLGACRKSGGGWALPAELRSADSRGRLSPQGPFFFFPFLLRFAEKASAVMHWPCSVYEFQRRSGGLISLSLPAEAWSVFAAWARQLAWGPELA